MLHFWIIALCSLLQLKMRADAAAGDNTADFLSLCAAWRAGSKLLATTYDQMQQTAELTDLLNLNMSLATNQRQAIFDEAAEHKTWAALKQAHSDKLKTADWSAMWPYWTTARKNTKGEFTGWAKDVQTLIKDHNLRRTKRLVRVAAEQALSAFLKARKVPTYGGKDAVTEAKTAAKQAVCGGPFSVASTGNLPCEDLTGNTDKQDTCGEAHSTLTGVSLAVDIVCLCSGPTGSQCTSAAVSQAGITDNNLKAGVLGAQVGACGTAQAQTAPEALLAEALAALTARIGDSKKATGDMQVYLGQDFDTDCGSSGSACIDYTQVFKTTKKGIDGIQWVANLRKEAAALEKTEEKKHTDAEATKLIQALKKSISREISQQDAEPPEQPNQQGQAGPTAETQNQKQKKCNNHKTNKTCTAENNCKWDSTTEITGEYCRYKDGEGQRNTATTAGAGEGAAGGTEANCSQYTDQDQCAKAPGNRKRERNLYVDGLKTSVGIKVFV
uniref:Variant surface glycoprotein 1125.1045 n=1 Tax=Trypanosoma brucei TaxID=5691 RepID=A0A1J0R644_9TRYP|nr:variant surface glycoprotein 1125.1045 [Trypanosoma brucei]